VHSGKTYVPGFQGVVPEQRLTRLQALEMATKKCGWFMELEDKVGTLEVGKYADLIVTSEDYFTGSCGRHPLAHLGAHGRDGKVVYGDAEFAGLD
jgi:predicted amidohydrolase YtcJ